MIPIYPPPHRPGFLWGFMPLLLGGIAACGEGQPTIYAAEFTDVFTQESRREIDVLLVVDSSGSMGDEQEKLAANFEGFINAFLAAEVDYHIGAITTDVADGSEAGYLRSDAGEIGTPPPDIGEGSDGEGSDNLPPPVIITPDTPDASAKFADLVRVGTVGTGLEMGMEAARLALSPPLITGHNSGFYRPEAGLAVVIFSDEDDLSPWSVDDYLNFFVGLKGDKAYRDRDLVTLSAVVGDAPLGCSDISDDSNTAYPGFRYIAAAERSGGIFQSICADDFAPVVEALSLDISGLKLAFPLSYCAKPESLQVYVDETEQIQGQDYTYDHRVRTVRFNKAAQPPPQSEVKIEYEFYVSQRFECPEEGI